MTPATSSYQPSRLVHDPLERHERQVLDGRGGRPEHVDRPIGLDLEIGVRPVERVRDREDVVVWSRRRGKRAEHSLERGFGEVCFAAPSRWTIPKLST